MVILIGILQVSSLIVLDCPFNKDYELISYAHKD
jgi:hypothetical protein